MDKLTLPAVVLVRPQEEGNVGASARAMANMGLESLLLVEPAPRLGRTAYAFAVGAHSILDNAERHPSLETALASYQRVVGTSSTRKRDVSQSTLEPRRLAAVLGVDPPGTRTALVFGPEASGLNNDELALCDPLVTVPCAPLQPTLNLAQAVLLVAYELHLAQPLEVTEHSPIAASTAEVEQLFGHLERLFKSVGFARDDTYASVLRELRHLAARTRPSEREVQILRGICRRTLHAVGQRTVAKEPKME